MRLVRIDRPPSAGVTRRQRRIALVVSMLLFAIAAFVVGTAARSPQPDPIQTRQGVPVGVERTPAGAVAAADDYLAIEQASVERDPVRFAALVAEDYSATLRASSLAEARADRHRDPRGLRLWMSGGQSFTAIAAHRLDWYRGDRA